MTDKPNPGSDEALDQGCSCPVMDNGHGKGPGPFWVTVDCPLHGDPQMAEMLARENQNLYPDYTLPHSEDDA